MFAPLAPTVHGFLAVLILPGYELLRGPELLLIESVGGSGFEIAQNLGKIVFQVI